MIRRLWPVAAIVAALLPLAMPVYYVSLATEILIFAVLAMSVDMLAGFAGRTSLCHGAIFGTSAYVTLYMASVAGFSIPLAMVAGLGAATVLAAVFGILAVRSSGVYFLLLTLALGLIVWGVCLRWTEITGGENGLRAQLRESIGLSDRQLYVAVLVAVAVATSAMWRFVRSPFGLTMRGIKEGEGRMASLGYNVPLHLLIAFTASGFFAGCAGVLYAVFNDFVSPSSVELAQSVQGLLMAIVGGVGTLFGSFIGSFAIIAMEQTVSQWTNRWPTILGLIFIGTMIFAPEGVLGAARAVLRRGQNRNK